MSSGPYYLALFPVSPLGSQGWPFSFTKPKVMMENATVDPGGWQGGQKALVQPLLPCIGVQRTALLAKQRARLPWVPLIRRSPSSPGIWYHERPARGSRQTRVSFSLQSPVMPYYDPLKGAQSRLLWELHCVCTTPKCRVPGQSCSEFG